MPWTSSATVWAPPQIALPSSVRPQVVQHDITFATHSQDSLSSLLNLVHSRLGPTTATTNKRRTRVKIKLHQRQRTDDSATCGSVDIQWLRTPKWLIPLFSAPVIGWRLFFKSWIFFAMSKRCIQSSKTKYAIIEDQVYEILPLSLVLLAKSCFQ